MAWSSPSCPRALIGELNSRIGGTTLGSVLRTSLYRPGPSRRCRRCSKMSAWWRTGGRCRRGPQTPAAPQTPMIHRGGACTALTSIWAMRTVFRHRRCSLRSRHCLYGDFTRSAGSRNSGALTCVTGCRNEVSRAAVVSRWRLAWRGKKTTTTTLAAATDELRQAVLGLMFSFVVAAQGSPKAETTAGTATAPPRGGNRHFARPSGGSLPSQAPIQAAFSPPALLPVALAKQGASCGLGESLSSRVRFPRWRRK